MGEAERFEARAIVAAFLGMAKHLRSRPQPRAQFDEVAAGRAATPGAALVRAARVCLEAAHEKDTATLEATRAEVEHFFDTLKLASLRGFERADVSAETALVEFARESSEAHAAVTTAAVTRSPDAVVTMRKEVRDAIEAGARVLSIGQRAALPSHTIPLGAVR